MLLPCERRTVRRKREKGSDVMATNNSSPLPQRIQRKRTKGWRMPASAIYVGRGTQWGNPFRAGLLSRQRVCELYRYEIVQHNGGVIGFNSCWVAQHLRGKDLACWCPLDQPCHADVLLELANA